MWVEELWRYLVRSTAGEQLEYGRLTPFRIDGDRVVQVHNGWVVQSRPGPIRASCGFTQRSTRRASRM